MATGYDGRMEPRPTASAGTEPPPARPVLVWTRPQPPSTEQAAALAASGLDYLPLPLIGTRRMPATAALQHQLAAAAEAAMRIYVSVEAVRAVAELAPGLLKLPSAAVGPHTAAALLAAGCADPWQPTTGLGAEALLALPQWSAIGLRPVALLHAPGGVIEPFRRLPGLLPIVVYQRYRRSPSPRQRVQLRQCLPRAILLGPSATIVSELATLLRERTLTDGLQRPLLVLSERVRARALALGFSDVRLCTGLEVSDLHPVLTRDQGEPQHPLMAEP